MLYEERWLSKKGHCAQWTHCISHPPARLPTSPRPASGNRLRSDVCIDTTCQFYLAGGGLVAAALRQAAKNEAPAECGERGERERSDGRREWESETQSKLPYQLTK